jgi:hypothetical protein
MYATMLCRAVRAGQRECVEAVAVEDSRSLPAKAQRYYHALRINAVRVLEPHSSAGDGVSSTAYSQTASPRQRKPE